MARRLSRRSKDLVCMRQLGLCGYCGHVLCDAFEVDHLNENRCDDRACNLVAACALCHAIKSRHVRLCRDWSTMREALTANLSQALDRWHDGAGWASLPPWLQSRVRRRDAQHYGDSIARPALLPLDLERFRFRPGPSARRRTG